MNALCDVFVVVCRVTLCWGRWDLEWLTVSFLVILLWSPSSYNEIVRSFYFMRVFSKHFIRRLSAAHLETFPHTLSQKKIWLSVSLRWSWKLLNAILPNSTNFRAKLQHICTVIILTLMVSVCVCVCVCVCVRPDNLLTYDLWPRYLITIIKSLNKGPIGHWLYK